MGFLFKWIGSAFRNRAGKRAGDNSFLLNADGHIISLPGGCQPAPLDSGGFSVRTVGNRPNA